MREKDLSAPTSKWLTAQGYTFYAEVPFFGRCVDMVGIREDRVIAVELKLSLSWRVIKQAATNELFAHESWCVVATNPRKLPEASVRCLGIARVVDGTVEVIRPAKESNLLFESHQREVRERCACRDAGGIGGIETPSGDGPAQEVARLVAPLRAGGMAWKDVYSSVPNHYASYRSLAGAMMGYGPTRAIIDAAKEGMVRHDDG